MTGFFYAMFTILAWAALCGVSTLIALAVIRGGK